MYICIYLPIQKSKIRTNFTYWTFKESEECGGGAKTLHTNVSARPEPQIKRHPNNLTLLLDSKAVLPCITLGNPKPKVTWMKDDKLIQVPERQQGEGGGRSSSPYWRHQLAGGSRC